MSRRRENEFDCNRIDELAGAIALGALAPDELAAAMAHLESCDQPHTELRELVGAASALAFTVEPRDPGPGLRARVLASAGAAAPGRPVARGATAPPANRRAWLDWSSVSLWRGVAFAAGFVLLIGAFSWVGLRQQVATQEAALSAIADVVIGGHPAYSVTGPAGSGYVIESEGPGATFLVAGLEEPPAGDIYELWLLDAAGTPLAVGTIEAADPRLAVVALERDLSGFALFAVTIEAERLDSPTGDVVIAGAISD